MSEPQTINPQEAQAAQAELCAGRGLPMFAPRNGVCWSCFRQVYSEASGLDGTTYVTSCPFCNRSYCD